MPFILPLMFVVAACDVDEVTVPFSTPVVVVHAIMRPDRPERLLGRQFVVVERSFSGEPPPRINPITHERSYYPDTVTIPYGGEPAIPVEGATVTVQHAAQRDDGCPDPVPFMNDPDDFRLIRAPGVYWSPRGCPVMQPGDRLLLRVETPRGEVVTGTTVVPAMDSAWFSVGGARRRFGTEGATTFNRDHDTLRIAVAARVGRLVQLEVRRLHDLRDFGTKIFADTTAVTLPGAAINTFNIGDEDDVFRAGRAYVVTVALTDTNYYDFARSVNNRYTGRGFINRLEGGLGVFGSLVAASARLWAVGDVDDPREGVYELRGAAVAGVEADLRWELYLARRADTTEFSAFVAGRWLWGPIEGSADGWFAGDRFTAVIEYPPEKPERADTLLGVWRAGQPFALRVFGPCRDRPDFPISCATRPPLATLTATQR